MDVYAYWDAVLRQDAERIRPFFLEDAVINLPNTNERFTVNEFVRLNCAYPGAWTGAVERLEVLDDLLVTVAKVCSVDGELSFHAVSFIRVQDDKIVSLDEYWGDDGPAPGWRIDMGAGRPIVS